VIINQNNMTVFPGNYSRYHWQTVVILFSRSFAHKIHLLGRNIDNNDIVYEIEIALAEDFLFQYDAPSGQRVAFELTVKKSLLTYSYVFFVSNIKSNFIAHYSIAHAMGQVDDLLYTNSLEAFLSNYANGIRVFEVDLHLSSDGKAVLFHEGKDYEGNNWISEKRGDISSAQFKHFKYGQKYAVLFAADLVELLKKYSDVYFVLDIKSSYPKASWIKTRLRKLYFSYTKRVIQQDDLLIRLLKAVIGEHNVKISDAVVLQELISLTEGDSELLDRLIPQTHKKNVDVLYSAYDFPTKIWRDGKNDFTQDVELAISNGISNYSQNGQKLSSGQIDKLNCSGIKLFLYNTRADKKINGVGYFVD
jgi:glycerophosphoryl diester phosphodiesterase